MKSLFWIAAVTLVIGSIPAQAATWESYEHLAGATAAPVLVQGKERMYFRLVRGKPLEIPVEGPSRLRVITRLELAPGATEVARYRVRATEAGTLFEELSTESSAASEVKPASGRAALGKSRRMTFDVPAGRHRVSLQLEGVDAVLVRVQSAAPAGGEEPMVSLTPIRASRGVGVIEGEKTVPYYTVLPGEPVTVRVVGPTRLELLTRLDFDPTMHGTQTYRLRLTERGRTLREIELKTTKATTANYSNLPDRVPSKFDRVRLSIGEGTHEVAVELVSPPHGSAEIHPRIPTPSVGNEE
jgi:hypothetical protein